METSRTRTIAPGWRRMAPFRYPTETRACETHGEYESVQTPVGWTGCPACAEKRYAEEDAARRAAEEQARLRRKADSLLQRAAIPPRFEDRRLENFVPHNEGARRALDIAQEYVDDFEEVLSRGRSLIFSGGVGAGKTHLAVGIAQALLARNRLAVFSSVLAAVRSIKDTYRRGSDLSESDAIARLVAPDLLILDEVGVQFGSETEKMLLFEIINGRYEHRRPTLVISNLAKESLALYLGERVVDRLRESGGRMVIFDWPSYRRVAT